MKNKQIRLKSRPSGLLKPENFETVVENTPALKDGEALVKTMLISIDIPIRILLEHDIPLDGGMFLSKTELGKPIVCFGNGKVVESKNPSFPVGSYVGGLMGVQEYNVVKANPFNHGVPEGVPLDVALNGLGNTGMTAYFGLFDLGQPKAGDTVLISAAAGSIGVIVAQLAKNIGCKVVGLAGGPEKCRWIVDEVGYDAAIDYKGEDVGERLKELCPEKINLYYDIVGGPLLDTVLDHMANHSRVVACGMMAEAPPDSWGGHYKLYRNLLSKRVIVLGLNASDFVKRYGDAGKELMKLSGEGKLRWFDTVIEGIDKAPDAINSLFAGGNKGKMLLRVAQD